jgi:hypothetical protein
MQVAMVAEAEAVTEFVGLATKADLIDVQPLLSVTVTL